VTGLGVTERIYAVRFIGDVGYVVTFRETDPLYTLDLSDPSDPTVVGELKILGYSAYLHPMGDDLLLGVGQDADLQGRRRARSCRCSTSATCPTRAASTRSPSPTAPARSSTTTGRSCTGRRPG
jgi:hypothetical protein